MGTPQVRRVLAGFIEKVIHVVGDARNAFHDRTTIQCMGYGPLLMHVYGGTKEPNFGAR